MNGNLNFDENGKLKHDGTFFFSVGLMLIFVGVFGYGLGVEVADVSNASAGRGHYLGVLLAAFGMCVCLAGGVVAGAAKVAFDRLWPRHKGASQPEKLSVEGGVAR
jgi:hypothetical protein